MSYHKHKEMFPGYDQHFYLAQAWLAFMKAKGMEVDDGSLSDVALTTTLMLACIPDPHCARALGIFILFRERGEEIQRLPELVDEFNELIKPVILAQESNELEKLYERYNPNMYKDWDGTFESYSEIDIS